MKLSEFELDVMQFFWEAGELCSPDIHRLISREKDVAYTTVKTIIDRLEEKGAICRVRQSGRSLVYKPLITRASITKSALPNFLKRFFGGSSRQLITQLLEDDNLSEGDIKYLQSVIAKHLNQD